VLNDQVVAALQGVLPAVAERTAAVVDTAAMVGEGLAVVGAGQAR